METCRRIQILMELIKDKIFNQKLYETEVLSISTENHHNLIHIENELKELLQQFQNYNTMKKKNEIEIPEEIIIFEAFQALFEKKLIEMKKRKEILQRKERISKKLKKHEMTKSS
ncbi:MAG: hypothetical protein ACTSVU_04850 [Promethearchaeota archaeon]